MATVHRSRPSTGIRRTQRRHHPRRAPSIAPVLPWRPSKMPPPPPPLICAVPYSDRLLPCTSTKHRQHLGQLEQRDRRGWSAHRRRRQCRDRRQGHQLLDSYHQPVTRGQCLHQGPHMARNVGQGPHGRRTQVDSRRRLGARGRRSGFSFMQYRGEGDSVGKAAWKTANHDGVAWASCPGARSSAQAYGSVCAGWGRWPAPIIGGANRRRRAIVSQNEIADGTGKCL